MRKFFSNFSEPLNLIREQPLQFTVWWIVAIFFGLAGFWLPLLLEFVKAGSPNQVFQNYIKSGNLASFSIVILADGLATTLVAVNAGRNVTAAGIRGLIGVAALILFIINVGVLSATHIENISWSFVAFQFIIASLAILSASYLYCFRSSEWEKSVGDVKQQEDEEVDKLSQTAASQSADETGVKL
jgi:hypothetical protein